MQGGMGKYTLLQIPVIDRDVFVPGIMSAVINIGMFGYSAF